MVSSKSHLLAGDAARFDFGLVSSGSLNGLLVHLSASHFSVPRGGV